MSFGMLVAPNLVPWGPSSESGGTWEHTEGDLGGPGLDFYRFWRISGPPFGRFWPTLAQQLCFFLACVFAGHVF